MLCAFLGLFCKFLDSFNRLEFVDVFVFVSSSLTNLMNFGQAFLVDFSLSPAHLYGTICIVIVIEQPMCQICRTGQKVVHGEENSIEEAPISRTFVRIVFSLVCSTSSYPIELVTELSCLLFDISVCTIVLP